MNILFLCEKTDGSDGWSQYTKGLMETLGTRQYTCQAGFQMPKPLTMLTRPFLAPFVAWKLWQHCRKNALDIIHITVEPYALIVPFLPKRIQQKIVLTLHGSYAVRPLIMWQTRWLARQYYKKISHFIAVSHYTKRRVIEELEKIGNGKKIADHVEQCITVIHNGVCIIASQPPLPPAFAKATAGKPGEGKLKNIIHVGGVKPIKGVLEAITAYAIYRDRYNNNVHLSILGKYDPEDKYVKAVYASIAAYQLDKYITLHGFVPAPELANAYQHADLLLLPSRTFRNTFEGFGLVFLEANARGVPVIGPNSAGCIDAIHDNVSGYMVDPKKSDEVAERIHWILDEHRIDPLHCRKWAKRHDIEHMATKVETVYRALQSI